MGVWTSLGLSHRNVWATYPMRSSSEASLRHLSVSTGSRIRTQDASPQVKKDQLLSALMSRRNAGVQNFRLGSDGASCLAVVKSMPVCAPPRKFYYRTENAGRSPRSRRTSEAKGGFFFLKSGVRTFSFVALIQQPV